jgi:hypothetical protein
MFPAAPFLSTLLDRMKAVVRRVARPVVERVRRAPADVPTDEPMTPVMPGPATTWLSARLSALSALLRRIEAGEMLAEPVRAARAARDERGAALASRVAGPVKVRLSHGFGWMCGFDAHARENGDAFAAWLSEPAMQARVLAAPERMAQLIGPILNATGTRRPAWFPVTAKTVRAARRREVPVHSSGQDCAAGQDVAEHADVVDRDVELCKVIAISARTMDERRGSCCRSANVYVGNTWARERPGFHARIFQNDEIDARKKHVHFVTLS